MVGEGGRRLANDRVVGELEHFLAERADHLMRTAVLLTGSHEAGQDLLRTALERRPHGHGNHAATDRIMFGLARF